MSASACVREKQGWNNYSFKIHIHFYHAHVVGDIICTYLAYKAVLLWSLNEGWPILFDGTDNSEDVNDWLFPEQGL